MNLEERFGAAARRGQRKTGCPIIMSFTDTPREHLLVFINDLAQAAWRDWVEIS